jgi:hypothetical protein
LGKCLKEKLKESEELKKLDDGKEKLEQDINVITRKIEAWKRLTIMIDAVEFYNEDFEEKKKYLPTE